LAASRTSIDPVHCRLQEAVELRQSPSVYWPAS
jgi:hypothetical protein